MSHTHNLRKRLLATRLHHIAIRLDPKRSAQILGPEQRSAYNHRIDTPHKNANDQAVVVSVRGAGGGFQGGKREALADGGFDGGGGGRGQVAELVGGADDEGAERARGELHEVDGDDAPDERLISRSLLCFAPRVSGAAFRREGEIRTKRPARKTARKRRER